MNTCRAQGAAHVAARRMLLALGFVVLSCAVLVLLSACDEASMQPSGLREIQIADKIFVVPSGWKYRLMPVSKTGPYRQISFTLDINTFENISPHYSDENISNLDIEVRLLRSEFGEKYYWTERDPIFRTESRNCRDISYSGQEMKVCEHDTSVMINSFAYGGFSLFDKDANEYISMFGCSDPHNKFKAIKEICTGRSRVLDNLQIEYVYRAENFHRAVELDRKIHEFVLSLYKGNAGKSRGGEHE